MGTHRKPKATEAKHAKPREQSTIGRKAAILGAGAVAVPVTALTFTPSAMAADTQNIPRIVVPAGGDVTAPADPAPKKCEDHIVNRGETFSGIARAYDVPLATLKPLNPGVIAGNRPDDYSLIFRGGHIHLPDGSCAVVTPPVVPTPTKHDHTGWHWKDGKWCRNDGSSTPPTTDPTTPPVVTNPGGEGLHLA